MDKQHLAASFARTDKGLWEHWNHYRLLESLLKMLHLKDLYLSIHSGNIWKETGNLSSSMELPVMTRIFLWGQFNLNCAVWRPKKWFPWIFNRPFPGWRTLTHTYDSWPLKSIFNSVWNSTELLGRLWSDGCRNTEMGNLQQWQETRAFELETF